MIGGQGGLGADVESMGARGAAVGAGGLLVTGTVLQLDLLIVLLSKVTAPLRANARPLKSAPVAMVMSVSARMFPVRSVFVPRVAELTTFHQTLHASPPMTLAVPDVTRVDADLKTQTPDPLRVSVPDSAKASAQ
ncbi:MAG: hypothetical protein UX12_C0026G0001 [Candidatus Collierbacteria bacterium GW2011_GWC1_45_47]|nr:MAG: hypothetical protein UX12_C0026G0001 [Candidatus Collierbacteria bacterium GW2011_GWC1_45_47]